MPGKFKGSRIIFKLRGLPFSAGETEIASFFHDVQLKEVHMVFKADGQLSGEAFVIVGSPRDASAVLDHNGKHIGRRFIEIHPSCQEQLDWYLRKSYKPDGTVRLVGLPYHVTREDLMEFFRGLEIVPNGVGILIDDRGRSTGEAYVQFISPEVAKLATAKHNEVICGRYVEIYPCNLVSANQAIQRQMYKNMGAYHPEQKRTSRRFWLNPYWLNKERRKNNASYSSFSQDTQLNVSSANLHRSSCDLFRGCPFVTALFGVTDVSCFPHAEYGDNNDGYCIRMRGLPFEATVDDILKFFLPLQPLRLYLHSRKDGRPDGTADVYFENLDDANKAMMRQKGVMGFRYIELFNRFNKTINSKA